MTDPLFDLTGRTALITGSTRGLGLAMASGLGSRGARIVINARNPEAVAAVTKSLRDNEIDAVGVAFDVADEKAVAVGVQEATELAGPIDILINNAGIQRRGPLHELSLDDFRAVMETNVTSAFLLSKVVAAGMITRRRGKIINIGSVLGPVGRRTTGAYVTSKGALSALTKAMSVDWAQYNIQANAIGPGYFSTELTESLQSDVTFDTWLRNRVPAGRWGQVEELIGAAVFLSGEASSFVNGQVLYVDGGMLASL